MVGSRVLQLLQPVAACLPAHSRAADRLTWCASTVISLGMVWTTAHTLPQVWPASAARLTWRRRRARGLCANLSRTRLLTLPSMLDMWFLVLW